MTIFGQKLAKFGLGILLIVIIGLAATQAFSQAVQGSSSMVPMKATLKYVEGVVMIQSGSAEPRQAVSDDVVGTGDKLQTKANGWVDIVVENGNVITIGPDTELALSNLAMDPATGNYENVMESNSGRIMANVAAKIKDQTKSKFQIKTPTAICGVRGTIFYLIVTATETRIFVDEGSTDFNDLTGGNKFVVVKDMAAISSTGGNIRELTGKEKEEVFIDYIKFLRHRIKFPKAPSMTDDTQSITENPPSRT